MLFRVITIKPTLHVMLDICCLFYPFWDYLLVKFQEVANFEWIFIIDMPVCFYTLKTYAELKLQLLNA